MVYYLQLQISEATWSLHPASVSDNEFTGLKHSNFAASLLTSSRLATKTQEFLKGSPE